MAPAFAVISKWVPRRWMPGQLASVVIVVLGGVVVDLFTVM